MILVKKLHILLTYNCSLRCKHCYVYSDQRAPGKISLSQISHFLNDAHKIEGIVWVYFGGGEPFTQYPLLLKAVQRARNLDYRVGVETNGYFARTDEAAMRMLRPLAAMGVEDLRVSNDALHYRDPQTSPANRTLKAARRLGIPTTLVRVSIPGSISLPPVDSSYADQVEEPRFMFTGRAGDLFSESESGADPSRLDRCPRDDLADPEQLYVDAYGYVQVCPGIAIGNACVDPLNEIISGFDIDSHEILPILESKGPASLFDQYELLPLVKIIDACHACFSARKLLIDTYPELLGPRHVYGY